MFLAPKVQKVTTVQLSNILLNLDNKCSTFVKVLQCTSPKTTKKCRDTKEPFSSDLRKITALSVLLNTNYVKGVERQLERENNPITEYKKGINTMPIDKTLSKNNFCGVYYGKTVIEYRPYQNSYPTIKFILNGKITNKSKLPNVLPVKRKASNQGTTKEIFWRKLYVKNIAKISIGGAIYKNIDCKI